jgi:hypothetical protein
MNIVNCFNNSERPVLTWNFSTFRGSTQNTVLGNRYRKFSDSGNSEVCTFSEYEKKRPLLRMNRMFEQTSLC